MSSVRFRTRRSAAASLLIPLLLITITALLGANGTPSFQDTVTVILCNLIIVIGLQVFVGNSGVYSFGQLGFATAGAYIAAFLTLPAAFALLQTPGLPHFIVDAHLDSLPSTLIAAALSGLLAIVVGLPLMRTSTLAIPISTFAFLLVVYNVVANWEQVTGGSSGLVSIPTTTSVESASLWAGAAVILALAYKWSASGYRLQATREDEVAARSIGIGVMRERLIAFGISGVLCGIGGALAVHQSGVLNPATFYFGATVTTMTMLVVGGARSVFGAVIGAIAIAAVNELLRGVENGASLFGAISIGEAPGLAAIGLGLILLATMIAMPNGLSGGREAGELSWLQRLGLSAPARPPESDGTAVDKPVTDRAANGALRADGISLAFAGLRVLKNVDLTLEPGEALGLIGPNGAGKTTLVNVLSGFQAPDSGTVSLDGVEVTGRSPTRLAHDGLGRTFQAALPFPDLSGLESVAVGAMGMGVSRRRAVAVAVDVLDRLNLREQATLPAGALPPGSQRLLGIARALAIGPRYLLLDEPAAGLNEAECEQLVAILRSVLSDFGCGILLIEHDMNIVMPLCSRVQVLDDGKTIRIGTPQEVQADPAVVESYLGSSFLAVADAELRDVRVNYGRIEVVHGVDLSVGRGEVVGMIGPNGAGKSSILRSICGLVRSSTGRATFEDRVLTGMAPEQIAQLGLALVPEGRHIFKTLTVAENLRLGAREESEVGELMEQTLARFPILRERAGQRADRLSGGEQQQLAIARALLGRPKLLILDEPSLGLAPKMIDVIYELLGELRKDGVTMLLVEQNAARTIDFCDRCLVLSTGKVRAQGSRGELQRNPDVLRAYLGRQP